MHEHAEENGRCKCHAPESKWSMTVSSKSSEAEVALRTRVYSFFSDKFLLKSVPFVALSLSRLHFNWRSNVSRKWPQCNSLVKQVSYTCTCVQFVRLMVITLLTESYFTLTLNAWLPFELLYALYVLQREQTPAWQRLIVWTQPVLTVHLSVKCTNTRKIMDAVNVTHLKVRVT